jgi:endonuclease/exonuclease/phosphatase family metal-dependent hydrolase
VDRVAVVTLNLWGEQPPLEDRMRHAIAGCRALNADVIALQEVREIGGHLRNTAATIAEQLGMQHVFAPATAWGGGTEGVAILSRFAIASHAHTSLPHATESETRVLLQAELTTPAGPLHVFTTHLNYRLTDGQKREDQIAAAERIVAAAPTTLPRIFLGDFNAVPDADEVRFLRGLRTVDGRRVFYQDAFARARPSETGHTWSTKNHFTTRLHWLERDRRIDYIFVSALQKNGQGFVHDCRVVFDEPSDRGCFASDHFGLYAEIQLAPRPPIA